MIGIISDHNGYLMKQELTKFLTEMGYNVIDYGTNDSSSVDYPDFAVVLGDNLNNRNVSYGIAICGTGIGMSIALNKINGIRCAKIDNVEEAMLAKEHNDANVISISCHKDINEVKEMVTKFLKTDFSTEERHHRRVQKIKDLENNG